MQDAAGMEVRGADSPAQGAAVDGGGETRSGGERSPAWCRVGEESRVFIPRILA